MFMFLASNTRPYISYAVHKSAIYYHGSRNSHKIAVKGILRYLKVTKDKGIIFKPKKATKLIAMQTLIFLGCSQLKMDSSISVLSNEIDIMLSSTVMFQSFGCPKCKVK
jgi:hypothetical protein